MKLDPEYIETVFKLMQFYGVPALKIGDLEISMPSAGLLNNDISTIASSDGFMGTDRDVPTVKNTEPVRVDANGEIEINPTLFGGE